MSSKGSVLLSDVIKCKVLFTNKGKMLPKGVAYYTERKNIEEVELMKEEDESINQLGDPF